MSSKNELQLDVTSRDITSSGTNQDLQGFVTVKVCNQTFGISVLGVQDVLKGINVISIPRAPREVAGSMNLRGRIVTVIDMRARLGLPLRDSNETNMHVVVEHNEDLYSFMVDSVGDVLNLPSSAIDKTPANIEESWKEISNGVFQLENELLVILDIQSLLTF